MEQIMKCWMICQELSKTCLDAIKSGECDTERTEWAFMGALNALAEAQMKIAELMLNIREGKDAEL